ncbi:hypothetical protein WN943_025738 [Citrus x changshan-huyou]
MLVQLLRVSQSCFARPPLWRGLRLVAIDPLATVAYSCIYVGKITSTFIAFSCWPCSSNSTKASTSSKDLNMANCNCKKQRREEKSIKKEKNRTKVVATQRLHEWVFI